MIIGNGLLARAFTARYRHDSDIIIFASGVSNSIETDEKVFNREREMIATLLQETDKRLIYFGSCGSVVATGSETPYMRHKHSMENIVTAATNGLVLRLPQVVGYTENPNTLTNFLHNRITSGIPFVLWANAERNLIDVDDVVRIGSRIIDEANGTRRMYSIASRESLPMTAIVSIFESILGCRACFTTKPFGSPLQIDASHAMSIAEDLGINMGSGYTESVLRKYYVPKT